ncbi:MAG: MinD/ParA family protein [Gammaproteobacteria bacterium]|nr:MinD/ParA family protein [Gammaproteobacteria bacterium]
MNKSHVIAISSGKGGVGKSNFATNLAINLSKLDYRVCLFDADINLSNVPILLGLVPNKTLADLFDGFQLDDIIFKGPAGLDVIAGASGVAEFVKHTHQQQKKLLQSITQLTERYDYLILDTAAGVDNQVLSFLNCAPYLILILTPEPTSITDAYALLKILKKQHYQHKILVMVNQVKDYLMAKNIFNRFSEAVEKYLLFKVSFIGYVVSDIDLQKAVLSQQALTIKFPDSPASLCIERISQRLDQALIKLNNDNEAFIDYFQKIIEARPLYESQLSRVNDIIELISLLSDSEKNDLFHNLDIQLNKKPIESTSSLDLETDEKVLPDKDKRSLQFALRVAAKV